MLKCLVLNLKTPTSDQDGISAYNINTISARQKPWCKYFIVLPDDAVERRKLGVNKERTTVALKGFI